MNSKIISSLLLSALFLFVSCKPKEAYLEVTNKVHNVKLENISYCGFWLGNSLLPGESTKKMLFSDDMDDVSFPMSGPIRFYMVRGENRVLLQTKENYELNTDQHLVIEITDETEVINPMN